MAQPNHTQRLALTEEALSVLFCPIDDAYTLLNPNGKRYESLKRLSDLHLICATNGVPISYEPTPANVAEVRLREELLGEANLRDDLARRLLGDLAYPEAKRRGMPWPNAGSPW